jgi:23S rRNA (cytosine1962-C5)-methyltransferase
VAPTIRRQGDRPGAGEPTVTISRRGAQRFAEGHPWIYRSDLAREPSLRGGEIVRVVDTRGWFQGFAFYSSKSAIALRRLTREDEPCDRDFFLRRIVAARALRESAFPGEGVYRALHAEADLVPGVVVDRYGDVLCLQLLVQAADARRELLADILEEVYRPSAIVERSDAKVRLLEGLEQRRGVLRGSAPAGAVEIREGGVRFSVDLLAGQKTGAFLDQRENHVAAKAYARGRGLDCFSYVGGFALQLASGCETVTAVETSESACAQLAANAALNGFTNVATVAGNAFDFLKAKTETAERFDVIVLDPPAFAKSKSAVPAARRGYKEINLRALQLLNPGGVLLTSSCSYHVGEEEFEELLREAAKDAQRSVQVVERRGAARDHPVLLSLSETRYLKCFVLRAL